MIDPVSVALTIGLGAAIAPSLTTRPKNLFAEQPNPEVEQHAPTTSTTAPLFIMDEAQTTVTFFVANPGETESPLQLIAAELAEYGVLTDGWDGDMAVAPNPRHLANAQALLEIVPGGVPFPKPMLSADGEVGLYWRSSEAFADIVVHAGDVFSLYVKELSGEGREVFLEDMPITHASRRALADSLRAFRRA